MQRNYKLWEGEQVKMSRNLYLRVLQRIVYFSLMICSIVMRNFVENFLGFKIGRLNLDKNLIEHKQDGWVSDFFLSDRGKCLHYLAQNSYTQNLRSKASRV